MTGFSSQVSTSGQIQTLSQLAFQGYMTDFGISPNDDDDERYVYRPATKTVTQGDCQTLFRRSLDTCSGLVAACAILTAIPAATATVAAPCAALSLACAALRVEESLCEAFTSPATGNAFGISYNINSDVGDQFSMGAVILPPRRVEPAGIVSDSYQLERYLVQC